MNFLEKSARESITYFLIENVLSSHQNAKKENSFDKSCLVLALHASSNPGNLSNFLSLADKKCYGIYAISFNVALDSAIQSYNVPSLQEYYDKCMNYAFEINKNQYLVSDDRTEILANLSKTKQIFELFINKFDKQPINVNTANHIRTTLDSYFRMCNPNTCYVDLDPTVPVASSILMNPISNVIKGFDNAKKHCFNTFELIAYLVDDNPINPLTGNHFDSCAAAVLKRNLRKEIACYKKFLDIINYCKKP